VRARPEPIWTGSAREDFQDFRNFLWYGYRHIGFGDPSELVNDFAHFVQTGPDRAMAQALRGIGKSHVLGFFSVWSLGWDPDTKVLCVSASKDLADANTTLQLGLVMDIPMLRPLMPRRGQRESMTQWDAGLARPAKDPSVKSVGVFGRMVGSHADLIVPDDIEVPNTSDTPGMRIKLRSRSRELESIVNPGGRIVYLGTPQNEETMYNELPERGYVVRVYPAEYPPSSYGQWGRLPSWIQDKVHADPSVVGTPLDPSRFGSLVLQDLRVARGLSEYRLQYMLDTTISDSDRRPLRLADLVVMDLPDVSLGPAKVVWCSDPEHIVDNVPCLGIAGDRLHRPMMVSDEWSKYTGAVMYIDPAGHGEDETAWAVVKLLNGMLFVTSWGGHQESGSSDGVLTALAKVAANQRVNTVVIESNFGDEMYGKLLQPHLRREYRTDEGSGVAVQSIRVATHKERRIIQTLEPVMNQHRLVVSADCVRREVAEARNSRDDGAQHRCLTHQISRVTKQTKCLRHDDRLDALAGAVRHWTEFMAADPDQVRADARRSALDDFAEGRSLLNPDKNPPAQRCSWLFNSRLGAPVG